MAKTKKVSSKKKSTAKKKESSYIVMQETTVVDEATLMDEMYQVVLIQGIVAFAFGLGIFLWPQISLVVFLTMFAIMTLVSGIMSVIFSFQSKKTNSSWFWIFLEGMFSIGIGLVTFAMPQLTGVTLVFILSAWAIVWGLVRIIMAFKLKEFMFAIVGIISVIFGVLLFKNPGQGVLALVQIISFFGMVMGTILTVLALKFRGAVKELS